MQLLTRTKYLEHFVTNIIGFQKHSAGEGEADHIPLVIMTSADTHADTVDLLETNAYFGAKPGQIQLVRQDLVPSLANNSATLATVPGDPFALAMKPHGLYACRHEQDINNM